ncbi:MAG: ABC transporter permease [Erysipelotrichaceae bacterium]|nr:ABC transporter permease [Erysipelotrichaceae bacterium]
MENTSYKHIDSEKFRFVNRDERIYDKKFENKPVGYFKDAWNRFKKSKASVVAAIIILMIILFSFLCPLFIRSHDAYFMDTYYSKKVSRLSAIRKLNLGICDGGISRDLSEKGLERVIGIGMGAEDWQGSGKVSVGQGMKSEYQPVIKYEDNGVNYTARVDQYLEVGFIYRSIMQDELLNIQEYEKKTGQHILYPLIAENEYTYDTTDANVWYKTQNGAPVYINSKGETSKIKLSDKETFQDNYLRDEAGNPVYYIYTGGGDTTTSQYKIRVLYYNYYQYLYGSTPEYLLGTDSQGYDMALRMAGGIKLSLAIAVVVSVINFIIGAIYGAIEGYYGGTIDLVMERISDILVDIPFIVCATLFQIHLAKKVGPLVCLLFSYILTGWIGNASRVRMQFYRFKNQEYVMAARTLGADDKRIVLKHIFPNTLGTIITSCALDIPATISSESMLSYLGIVNLGSARITSIGTLLSEASGIWTNYPHLMICPALIISLLMICFNLFGNGLRDAFNPALRGNEE